MSGETRRAFHHLQGLERHARTGRRPALLREDAEGSAAGLCGLLLRPLAFPELSRTGLRRRQPEPGQQALLRGRVHEYLAPDGTPGGYGPGEEHRHEQHDDPETGGGSAPVPDQAGGDRDGTASLLPTAGAV